MPRKGPGTKPAGANRTDLLTPGAPKRPAPGQGQPNGQPIQVPTGLPYGEAQALQQAQQAQPVGGMPTPPAPGPAPAPAPAPQGGAPAPAPQPNASQAARNFTPPALGDITGPTQRPGEHVMTMPGASSLTPPAPPGGGNGMAAMLSKMASAVNSPALAQLAQRATNLGQ